MNQRIKKKVLLITSNFYPEETGISVYSTDLAVNVLASKYDVSVVTTLPHYPWWHIPQQFSHIQPGTSRVKGIRIFRLKHYVPKKSTAIGRARMEMSFWRQGKKLCRSLESEKLDLVIAIMPLVSSGLIARHISKKLKIGGIVIFQDLSALGARQAGLSSSKALSSIARFLESRASKWAAKIVVVSRAMIPEVKKLTRGKVPILIIHNYSVVNPMYVSLNEARDHLGMEQEQFIILHSGNMGHKQDLQNVVEAAKHLKDNKEVKFLLVGHGNQEAWLKREIHNLENIEIQPLVSAVDFPRLLSSANILLLNESAKLREMSLPSKLTSYLSAGRPVLAAVSAESATSDFLSDCAYIIEPGNPKALVDAILDLKSNTELQSVFAGKGRDFAIAYLSSDAGRGKYLKLVSNFLS